MGARLSKIFIGLVGLMLAILLAFGDVAQTFAAGSIIYVNWNASGANNGASWADAYNNLQSAIGVAISGDQIWVAKGTYEPTTSTDKTISFNLKNGVLIYGGFAGTETLLSQRNPTTNITILSGDIGVLGDSGDNSNNVVKGNFTNNTAVLDGFKIVGGTAFGIPGYGGGISNNNSSPTLRNLIISGNIAYYGGGMGNLNGSNPALINVAINGNFAGGGGGVGGGMYNYNSSPTLRNVTFSNNQAYFGGGIYNGIGSNPALTNVTFNGNQVSGSVAGLYNDSGSATLNNVTMSGNISTGGSSIGIGHYGSGSLQINNSIIWDNGTTNIYIESGSLGIIKDSIITGGCPSGGTCTAVRNVNPILGPLQGNGGYTQTMAISPKSPAIDTGNNLTCATTDQRGVKRPQGTTCDIGAYELKKGKMTFKSQANTDGWLLESGEKTNKGGSLNKTAPTLRLGDSFQKKQYRSILSFNTKFLPDKAVITRVTLRVKKQAIVGGGAPVIMFQGFMADVRKGFFFTSPALQLFDFQAAPPRKTVGPFKPALVNGWYNINLTASKGYINKWAANGGVTQVRLRFKLDDNNNAVANYLSLFSGNALLVNRPQLVIEYYVP